MMLVFYPKGIYTSSVDVNFSHLQSATYFVSYLKPEEFKDGKLKVALCRQTITYTRETKGDAGAVWDTKMEVIGSIECQGFRTPLRRPRVLNRADLTC